jgi:polyphosphate kinase 2 (PPK2 family)
MAKDRIRLDEVDQSKKLDQDEYKKLLKKYQLELLNAQLVLRESKKSLIVVLEAVRLSA